MLAGLCRILVLELDSNYALYCAFRLNNVCVHFLLFTELLHPHQVWSRAFMELAATLETIGGQDIHRVGDYPTYAYLS